MKIKQKILITLVPLAMVLSISAASLGLAPSVSADCAEAPTAVLNCSTKPGQDTLWYFINMAITILTAGVGVLALAGVVYGAVLYTSAGGNPEQVKKAKGIFTNVVIGVIAFAAMYGLLNFIIPGGVFN